MQQRSNLENWQLFMKNVAAPDSFIDMSFYYMIASCLQRRVWLQDEYNPVFPNQYIILVADPGIGKGLTVKPVAKMLRTWKYRGPGQPPYLLEKTLRDNATSLVDKERDTMMTGLEAPLQFPTAPDNTSYANLVKIQALSIRRVQTKLKLAMAPGGMYVHSSLAFALEEMSSLFKKKADEVVEYLLVAYDCGDYVNETISRGADKVKNCCLNLLAGTTPGFIRRHVGSEIISDGFSSRALFVYEPKSRFYCFGIASMTEEQIAARELVLQHLAKLAMMFGQVSYTPEAHAFMKDYFENILPVNRINNDPKLIHYYSRKAVHAMKMSMAIHFSDSTDMVIGLAACEKALIVLGGAERLMHMALDVAGRNPLYAQQKKMLDMLRYRPMSKVDILKGLESDISLDELDTIINEARTLERIESVTVNNVIHYILKKKELPTDDKQG